MGTYEMKGAEEFIPMDLLQHLATDSYPSVDELGCDLWECASWKERFGMS